MLVGDACVFPGFLTPVLTQLFFKSHLVHFSQASAEVRSENTPEKLPQPSLELTTTRLWVWHAHHWATWVGLLFGKGLVMIRKYFQLGKSKILTFGRKLQKEFLTLSQTIRTFNDPAEEPFGKLWKKEKMLATSIFSFSINLFYHSKDKFKIFILILLSANALHLDQSIILSFGKELKEKWNISWWNLHIYNFWKSLHCAINFTSVSVA